MKVVNNDVDDATEQSASQFFFAWHSIQVSENMIMKCGTSSSPLNARICACSWISPRASCLVSHCMSHASSLEPISFVLIHASFVRCMSRLIHIYTRLLLSKPYFHNLGAIALHLLRDIVVFSFFSLSCFVIVFRILPRGRGNQ